jgi:hypothetical protein
MMDGRGLTLLSEAQQRIYVDAIFAMAALDGFEIDCTTGGENGDRPVTCVKRIGNYSIEIGWSDETYHVPDATKAVWEVEVNEFDPGVGGGWKVHVAHVALHGADALRIARGLVRLYHALTKHARADTGVRVAANNRQTVG